VGDLNLKQAVEEYRDIYLAYRNIAQRTREEYAYATRRRERDDLLAVHARADRRNSRTAGKVSLLGLHVRIDSLTCS